MAIALQTEQDVSAKEVPMHLKGLPLFVIVVAVVLPMPRRAHAAKARRIL
jgi:hypothetical protein